MSKNIEELFEDNSVYERVFNEAGNIDEETKVTIREAFGTRDAPILFPKVISRTLKEAAEPVHLVTPMLNVVRTDGRAVEIPAVNSIQASIIAEGQEYPEQALAFEKQREGKISKKGVKVVFTEEVINDSQWDIVGLHIRAAGRAMARLKEQIALSRFADAGQTVFDNTSSTETTGRGIDGLPNDTLSWIDYIDMAAVLHAENKSPTDFILHPLMWPAFLKSAPFHNATLPGHAWNANVASKEGAANGYAPLGMNVLLSPFVEFNAAAGANPATSDVFLIDRNDIGTLLVREEMSTDDWLDLSRDLRALKMKERYDIVCYGDGEGITVAKGVALAPSYDVQVVNEVTIP